MNRPINSGKRVDGVDRFSAELSRFVRLDRFQGVGSIVAKEMLPAGVLGPLSIAIIKMKPRIYVPGTICV